MNRIKPELIIFDLGRVLIDFDFKKVVGNLKRHTTLTEKEIYNWFEETPLWDSFEKGQITPEHFFQELTKELQLKDLAYSEFLPFWNEIFTENHDTIAIAEQLRKRYKLAILSNVNVLHWTYVQRYPLIQLFHHPLASYAIGHRKPDPEIYQHALTHTGFAPDKTVFIDDLEQNVLGARAVGIRSHVFTNAAQLRIDLGDILE